MLRQRIAVLVLVGAALVGAPIAAATINPHNGENLSAEAQDAFNEECGRDGSGCNGEEQEEVFEEDAETPIVITIGDPLGVFSISWTDEY